ncbi:mechanosensitive ion channel family protein [Pseudobacter ginsenosidimutans]|jgi:MscS family membrane protein|uniref:MscS family membrane protein n=1 Tax=Pseudobacter ginsenosidimutans TaxID=661488 RepID=A0A4Q7MTV9_9BACT|nr:mechanosensitive ion channel domain-containing protein [Pseudobacter ginsenosidimutans]QEC41818.1 mechanosensitive ion channel [Pseudobacter ginsenosidimutans]RZS71369.1 MscS family membrane protein [Pseudobacter ginsenosidimutans]
MDKFLDTVILDNTIRSYLMVAGTILLVLFLKRYLSRYIAGLLFRVVRKIARGIDKPSFVNLVVSPLETFLLLVVSIISLDKLSFPEVLNVKVYKISLHSLIDGLAIIVVIITFIWLLLRIIDFVAMILHQKAEQANDQQDNQLVVFFKDFFKVMFVIIGFLMVLKFAFSYPITNLITALSIGGAAIALSTRESLENLIASFIIFIDKPFMVGDIVKVQSITGTVEKIGLRSTRIRTDQKTYVTMPNKQMVDSVMDNLSLRTQRRGFMQLELNADTPKEAVQQLVLGIQHLLQLRKDQIESSSVFLADIVKNSFIVQLEFFTAPIPVADFNAVRQDLFLSIIDLMEEMNIRLAAKENEIVVTKES